MKDESKSVEDDEEKQPLLSYWKGRCRPILVIIALLVICLIALLASLLPPTTEPSNNVALIVLPPRISSTQLSACLCPSSNLNETDHECYEENSMNIERAKSTPLSICIFPANSTEFQGYKMKHLVSSGLSHLESNSTVTLIKNSSTTVEDGTIQVQLNSNGTFLFLSISLTTDLFPILDVGTLEIFGSVAVEAEDRKLFFHANQSQSLGGGPLKPKHTSSDQEHRGQSNINPDSRLRFLADAGIVENFSLLVYLIEQTSSPSRWPTPSPNQTTSTDSKSNPPLDMNNTTGLLPSVLPTSLPSEVSY